MDRTEHARLHLPSAPMRHCLFMAVERDTRDVDLDAAQRFNYYPASPLPTISWIFEGELRLVLDTPGAQAPVLGDPLPRISVAGPHAVPIASWSPGPVHALTVAVYPEFLARTGVDLAAHADRVLAFDRAFGTSSPWRTVCEAVQAHADAPFPQLEAALEAWIASAVGSRIARPSLRSWVASLALQAAFAAPGIGPRQLQRRIRALTGRSRRDLQLYARTDDAFATYARTSITGDVDWASLALETGFADQSHFGREVRRVSGYAPAQLQRMIEREEAFWFYRLMQGYHRQA